MPALGEALAAGRMRLATAGLPAAGLEARVLLEHAAGLDSAAFLARVREPLAAAAAARYEELLAGRAQRAPLAYLTGAREFWSLRLAVDSRVLVPRPETESLVEATLARVEPAARIADIGTGSGAVAIALAVVLPRAAFWAVDCSAGALALARANAETHGLSKRIAFLEGDLADPLAPFAGTIDAIVSNPPYIPSGDIAALEPEVRDHEPRLALDGGADGLAALSRLVAQAPRTLRRGGWLLLEVGAGQAASVRGLIGEQGAFEPAETVRDLAGIERVVAARRRR